MSMLRAKRRDFGNVVGHLKGPSDLTSLADPRLDRSSTRR